MALLILGALLGAGGAGCQVVQKRVYRPDEMRQLIRKRVPGIRPEEIVVPWEVRPEDVKKARSLLAMHPSQTGQAHALADALSSPSGFDLSYAQAASAPAFETLRSGEGNCFALASVYVGLARAVGLSAYYLDFSGRIRQMRDDGEVLVNAGHVTGVISIGRFRLALDVGNRLTWFPLFRFLDDVEAVAHYYNNRGYDLIYQAMHRGKKIPWARARRFFWIATRVRPDFVRAWNNLGVAYARLGGKDKARQCYRQAIGLRSGFASAYTNLGLLALKEGDLPAAMRLIGLAIENDSSNPNPRYLLGLARYRYGQIDRAIQALEAALDLNKNHTHARELLAAIYTRLGHLAAAEAVMPAPVLSNANPGGEKQHRLKPFVRWPGK